MTYIIDLPNFKDDTGNLTVIEKVLPFTVKRVYFISDINSKRGGHRHKKNVQALICLGGSCEIYLNNNKREKRVVLDSPNKCLIIDPKEWHTMDKFTKGSMLLVLASENYDADDYIDKKYV